MLPSQKRRPGEGVFAIILTLASAYLLYSAYGIAGFEALSSPGAIPMAATATLLITSGIILWKTFRLPKDAEAHFLVDALPPIVIIIMAMLLVYAIVLQPVGFLPTSAVFIILSIKFLSHRSWGFSVGVGLLSLLAIYLLFRIVFTVLMPTGIVPEGEILAWIHKMLGLGV